MGECSDRHRNGIIVVGLICLLTCIGCASQNDDQLAVYPATGEVSVDGKPAAGVYVVLTPAKGSEADEKGLKPTGTTDQDGLFSLSTYQQADGAPAGDYVITIQWMKEPTQVARGVMPGFSPPQDHFRGKYLNPEKSAWRVTIDEGENVLEPISVN